LDFFQYRFEMALDNRLWLHLGARRSALASQPFHLRWIRIEWLLS